MRSQEVFFALGRLGPRIKDKHSGAEVLKIGLTKRRLEELNALRKSDPEVDKFVAWFLARYNAKFVGIPLLEEDKPKPEGKEWHLQKLWFEEAGMF